MPRRLHTLKKIEDIPIGSEVVINCYLLPEIDGRRGHIVSRDEENVFIEVYGVFNYDRSSGHWLLGQEHFSVIDN